MVSADIVAELSEASLTSLGTTVAVLSASVAVGSLLHELKSRLPARAGTKSQASALGEKGEVRVIKLKLKKIEKEQLRISQYVRMPAYG